MASSVGGALFGEVIESVWDGTWARLMSSCGLTCRAFCPSVKGIQEEQSLPSWLEVVGLRTSRWCLAQGFPGDIWEELVRVGGLGGREGTFGDRLWVARCSLWPPAEVWRQVWRADVGLLTRECHPLPVPSSTLRMGKAAGDVCAAIGKETGPRVHPGTQEAQHLLPALGGRANAKSRQTPACLKEQSRNYFCLVQWF